MKPRHFFSSLCLAVAVMFILSVSVHPALAYDAISDQIDCATCGTGLDNLSSIPGLENVKTPKISIQEIFPEKSGAASSNMVKGRAATAGPIQTRHVGPMLTVAIQDPRTRQHTGGQPANGPVMAAAISESTDPVLAEIIANMSSEGYELTDESSHQYESTVGSEDIRNMNSTQKQALAAGGFTLTAEDTVLSHRVGTFYTFTSRTTQAQLYVLGVQRVDAGGNPLGKPEYSKSPEFNADGSVAKKDTIRGSGMMSASGNGNSCWLQWLYLALAALGLVLYIVFLILLDLYPMEMARIFPFAMAALVTIADVEFGNTQVSQTFSSESFRNFMETAYGKMAPQRGMYFVEFDQASFSIVFSATTITMLIVVGLVLLVALLYAIYQLGVCKGWWDGTWMNHDWDHTAGDFSLYDNGKPQNLYLHDRFMVALYADTSADKNAKWTIVPQDTFIVRQAATGKTETGTFQVWVIEANRVGHQDLTLKYETTKSVPSTVGFTTFTLPVTVSEIPWTITTVDNAFNPSPYEPVHSMTQYDSLVYDPSGIPHIAYYDDERQSIMYGTFRNGAWTTEKVVYAVGYGSVSLAFDPAGNPAICYGGLHINMGLMYGHRDGSTWSFEKVADGVARGKIGDAGTGYYSSLVIDSAGTPHIIYNNGMKGNSANLMYATKSGTEWKNSGIGPGVIGYDSSAVMDNNGKLHVAFRTHDAAGSIQYGVWDGSNWLVKKVAEASGDRTSKKLTGYHVSIALDSLGNPHISFYDEVGKALRYVSSDGTSWATETVYATGDVGKYSSLAINAGNQPFISFFDETNGELRFATRSSGSRWEIHTIDNSQKQVFQCSVGEFSSLALDPNGHPNIAYYDCPNHALKFAGWKL